MIVAETKPFEEIYGYIANANKILITACGTCVTVCMAGGEKEAGELASILELKAKEEGKRIEVSIVTPKRQCDAEFLDEIHDAVNNADMVVSLGCGAGVQYMAERFHGRQVVPGVNTRFIGVAREAGLWTEMCQGCGDCVLARTGGVCPVSRCSKSNFNGPCGGSSNGRCEIDSGVDCGWQLIYERLKELGKLESLYEIIEPRDWRSSRDGGPRKTVKEDVRL